MPIGWYPQLQLQLAPSFLMQERQASRYDGLLLVLRVRHSCQMVCRTPPVANHALHFCLEYLRAVVITLFPYRYDIFSRG